MAAHSVRPSNTAAGPYAHAMRAVMAALDSTRPGASPPVPEDVADATATITRACGRLRVTAKLLDALPSNDLREMDQDDLSWFMEMLAAEIVARVEELDRCRIDLERAEAASLPTPPPWR